MHHVGAIGENFGDYSYLDLFDNSEVVPSSSLANSVKASSFNKTSAFYKIVQFILRLTMREMA
jgi:hypothetical protein